MKRRNSPILEDLHPPTLELLKNTFPQGIPAEQLPDLLAILDRGPLSRVQLARTVSVALGMPHFRVWDVLMAGEGRGAPLGPGVLEQLRMAGYGR